MLFETFDAEQFRPDWFVGGYGTGAAHLSTTAIAETHGLSPRMFDPRTDIDEF
jgi:hypothetical protein